MRESGHTGWQVPPQSLDGVPKPFTIFFPPNTYNVLRMCSEVQWLLIRKTKKKTPCYPENTTDGHSFVLLSTELTHALALMKVGEFEWGSFTNRPSTGKMSFDRPHPLHHVNHRAQCWSHLVSLASYCGHCCHPPQSPFTLLIELRPYSSPTYIVSPHSYP